MARKPRVDRFPIDEALLPHAGIRRAVHFVHLHYSDTLDLEQTAAQAHLSKYYFSRLFHRSVGMSYQAYLAGIRIQKAKELLAETPHRSVCRVAYEVGFESLRNFQNRFKQLAKETPSQYRARLR